MILERKAAGNALVRLPCGCEQWLRIRGDVLHQGRRVTGCCTAVPMRHENANGLWGDMLEAGRLALQAVAS